jgi:antitoxin (DNA-binding transcriptional repressor) of toxin-antitoxin stability system
MYTQEQSFDGGNPGVDPTCETCYTKIMTTFTIRDLRQRWPVIEKAVEEGDEVVVTRDGKPVVKLTRYEAAAKRRPRFNPKKHLAKMRKILGGTKLRYSIEERLIKSRADRWERK